MRGPCEPPEGWRERCRQKLLSSTVKKAGSPSIYSLLNLASLLALNVCQDTTGTEFSQNVTKVAQNMLGRGLKHTGTQWCYYGPWIPSQKLWRAPASCASPDLSVALPLCPHAQRLEQCLSHCPSLPAPSPRRLRNQSAPPQQAASPAYSWLQNCLSSTGREFS